MEAGAGKEVDAVVDVIADVCADPGEVVVGADEEMRWPST
jgi:hypothetical protein